MGVLRLVVLSGLAVCLALGAAAPQSLDEVMREPRLERRAALALDFARPAVGRMVKAYMASEPERAREILASIVQAAVVAQESLGETGKHARSKPKHFKNAEIATRKLVRDLEAAKRELTFEERPDIEPAIEKIEEINRQLLFGIMEGKK